MILCLFYVDHSMQFNHRHLVILFDPTLKQPDIKYQTANMLLRLVIKLQGFQHIMEYLPRKLNICLLYTVLVPKSNKIKKCPMSFDSIKSYMWQLKKSFDEIQKKFETSLKTHRAANTRNTNDKYVIMSYSLLQTMIVSANLSQDGLVINRSLSQSQTMSWWWRSRDHKWESGSCFSLAILLWTRPERHNQFSRRNSAGLIYAWCWMLQGFSKGTEGI